MRIIPIGNYSIKIYSAKDGVEDDEGSLRVFNTTCSTDNPLVNHTIFGRNKVKATEDNIKRAIRYCERE